MLLTGCFSRNSDRLRNAHRLKLCGCLPGYWIYITVALLLTLAVVGILLVTFHRQRHDVPRKWKDGLVE